MKRNFDFIFTTFSGDPILSPSDAQPLTLAAASISALMAGFDDERQLDGKAKFERYLLAQRIHTGGVVDVAAEEISLLKTLIGKAFGAIIVGQAYQQLEQDH